MDSKGKTRKRGNPRAHSRISYLHRIAKQLSLANNGLGSSGRNSMNMEIDSGPSKEPQAKKNEIKTEHPQVSHLNVPLLKQNALPAYLNSHMSTLRLKTDARVPRNIKRSICKRCKAQLINGQTSSTSVENKSRGGKKPWANVLVISCRCCGMEKRYPQEPKARKSLIDIKD